jgi:hypothetical protein
MALVLFIEKLSNAHGGWSMLGGGMKGQPEPLTPFGLGSHSRLKPLHALTPGRWYSSALFSPPLPSPHVCPHSK